MPLVDLKALTPLTLRGYKKSWLKTDIIAGVTLAAVAIPETMGYTSIAQTPIVTGLYTVIFPTLLFALLGSSRLLVVGADSATAAILAAGLATVSVAGLTPNTEEWLAYTSFIALLCGGMLLVARVAKLGFLGDFLSASVLIGFLTGVGVQVATGQLPDMLGIPKGAGNWLQQQWELLTNLGSVQWLTLAFAVGALVIILGFKKFLPAVPGAIIAVIGSIIISALIDASSKGVAVVGEVQGGFPPIGLPQGIDLSTTARVRGNRLLLLHPDHRPVRGHLPQFRHASRPEGRCQPRHRGPVRGQLRSRSVGHIRCEWQSHQDADPRRTQGPYAVGEHHDVGGCSAGGAVPHRVCWPTCPKRCWVRSSS